MKYLKQAILAGLLLLVTYFGVKLAEKLFGKD